MQGCVELPYSAILSLRCIPRRPSGERSAGSCPAPSCMMCSTAATQ